MLLAALSPKYSFSHKAALIAAKRLEEIYGELEVEFKPRNIDVLKYVEFRRCLGVVAFRNSSKRADIVPQVVREYWFEKNNGARLFAIGEIKLRIHHNVLVREHIEHPHQIRQLITHPHAHDQTLNIKRFGIHAPYLEATSTAEAARLIATDPAYRNSAAIASKEAAAGYGLKMLFENVEDDPDNVTRFHALSTEPAAPTGNDKTALIFQIANSRHVLHRVRELITVEGKDTPFVRALTSHDDPKSAFYCEFSGHVDASDGRDIWNALKARGEIAAFLGSFPKPPPEPE